MDKILKLFKKTIFMLVMATIFLNAHPVSTNVTDDAISAYCEEVPDFNSLEANH